MKTVADLKALIEAIKTREIFQLNPEAALMLTNWGDSDPQKIFVTVKSITLSMSSQLSFIRVICTHIKKNLMTRCLSPSGYIFDLTNNYSYPFLFKVENTTENIIENKYICKKCGSSAYLGLFDIDCPKCGKY